MNFLILSLLFFCSQHVDGAKVLVLSQGIGMSHVRFVGNIADILARDGHNVTVLRTPGDPSIKSFGVTEPNIEVMALEPSTALKALDIDNMSFKKSVWEQSYTIGMTFDDLKNVQSAYKEIFDDFCQQKDMIQKMKNKKFDVLIMENFGFGFSAFNELFEIPVVIAASAIGSHESFYLLSGVPHFSSFTPLNGIGMYHNMNLLERMENIYYHLKNYYIYDRIRATIDSITSKHYPDMDTSLISAQKKTSFIFYNGNEFTESPRPLSSMIQYVGGASIYEPKPLNAEWIDIVTRRPTTVIMSFGTFTNSCEMLYRIKQEFLKAFSEFPDITFVWKYDECKEEPIDEDSYKNIVFTKWLPQSDLLAHPNVKLFITHAGLNSVIESMTFGVPMITIPLFGDQLTHSMNAEKRGVAIRILKTHITSTLLSESINKLLSPNNSYQQKANLISLALKGRSQEYREKICQKVRLLAANGGPLDDMVLYSNQLSFIELYSLDVIFIVFVFISLLGFVVVYSLRYVVRGLVFSKNQEIRLAKKHE